VPKPFADHLILKALYESKGCAVAIPDGKIVGAMKEIASKEGFFICPEAAATVVALRNLLEKNFVKRTDSVVLFNTATGIKYPDVIK
jgi:threonine synthase